MRNRINVAAAAVNQTPLDWTGNQKRIAAVIAECRSVGVALVCLPELCITGYGCEDMFLAPSVGEKALQSMEQLLPLTKGLVVAVGLPLWFQGSVFNAAALLADGRLVGFACKQNLAGDGLHYEPRWFKPWPQGVSETFHMRNKAVPIGDLLFEVDGIRIGFEICEDAWVAARPGISLARRGVDVILNPSASHFAFGKQAVRERFVLEGSRAFSCGYVYANLLGNESGRIIFDGGTAIASGGKLVAAGKRFSFRDHSVTQACLDVDISRMHLARQVSHEPFFFQGKPDGTVRLNPGVFDASPFIPCAPTWRDRELIKEEEFALAEALGLFDYMRKSASNGFVVSLSGGADSGAITCLIKIMVDLAVAELGHNELKKRLPHLKLSGKNPMPFLLTCIYQATRHSGDVTRNAARSIAAAVGARYQEWDIDFLVEGYRLTVERGIGRQLSWHSDDLALQNIQARVRSPGAWMLANIQNALLLSTSNRSEAAVGYATMDGDTSGGLSPICGIDKAFLRHWLRWLEKEASPSLSIHPIPELSWINEQEPTAELRPSSQHQTDEGDLMPYLVLDAIEKLAIRDKKLPVEVYELIRENWSHVHHPDQLKIWVIRFFKLWCRNQWKRERYAPSFHLDDESLDPRTWCRFPILSGGFQDELAELENR